MAKVPFDTRTIMTVPHKGKKAHFDSDFFGPTTYKRLGKCIDEARLLRPTFSEIVSLAYSAAMNQSDVYAQRVKDILMNKDRALCTFDAVRNPESGVLLISDRNRQESEFPVEFKIGDQTLEEFAKNPRVKALCGDDKTTKKLVNLAKKLKLTPYVDRLNYLYEDTLDISMLSARDGRLVIGGSNFDYYDGLCSFGVLKIGRRK